MAWSSCSTMHAVTSESYSIQKTCSAEEVGYTGTGWAPTAQRAKSKSVHSYRVLHMIATRSPNRTPSASSPLASAST